MSNRPKGVLVYSSPANPLVAEAERNQKQERLRLQTQRAERREQRYNNAPNHITYRNVVFFVGKNIDENGRWLGGKLPPCEVCGGNLPPGEHHQCSGFQPKYIEHDDEWKERAEARREAKRKALHEAIREARRMVCSVCGEEMPEPEDGQWHWDAHEGRPEREHLAVDGEPDGDLDGYDDEPEDDYCEGDDDGLDCD